MCPGPPRGRLGGSKLLAWTTCDDNAGEENIQNGQRDRGSMSLKVQMLQHGSSQPWLVPDATQEQESSLVGEGTGSGVTLLGFLFWLHYSPPV